MKSTARIMWAGIEFQPDLQNPRKPVRLGVLSLTSSGDGVLLGRQPILHNKPPEFNDVSSVSLELAANWIDSMWKDILEANKENVAKQTYERFVGEPFRIPVRRPHRTVHRHRHANVSAHTLPEAWLISEISKRSLPLRLADGA